MKRPIDKIRESAGSATVGDGAPIVRAISMSDDLLLVTTKSVFKLKLADQIDPQRQNINIPWSVQQKVLSYGSESHFVATTLLATSELVTTTYFGHKFPVERALQLSLENAIHLCEMNDTIVDLQTKQRNVEQELAEIKLNRKQFVIPQTANLRQRSDHLLTAFWRVCMNLIAFSEIFYPKPMPNVKWLTNLETQMLNGLAAEHPLREAFPQIIEILNTVIAHRHAFTHPDASKCVILADYELTPSMVLEAPSITIKHEKYSLSKTPILRFCENQLRHVVACSETLLAWLCELNVDQNKFIEHHVEKLPADKMQAGSPLRWHTTFRPGFPVQNSG